jgi:hypothetical protein
VETAAPPPVPPADLDAPPAPSFRIDTRSHGRHGPTSGGATGFVVSLLLVAAAGTLAYVSWPKLAPHLAPVFGPIAPPDSNRATPDDTHRDPAAVRETMADVRTEAPSEPPVDAAPRRAVPPALAEPRRDQPAAVPAPVVASPPDDRPATPASAPGADRAAVEAAIEAAARALREEDWATAGDRLAAAEAAARDDAESLGRAARWRRLLVYAEGFGSLRDEALAASVGNEYTVDGKLISIVEANAERFIYRRLGRNKTMPPGEIPRAIIVDIVTQWFHGANRSANELFLGAYHVCREPPNTERARAAWQRARRGGEADADLLLQLLDDPALVAPAP